jgi:hypothetical protein
MIFKLFLLLMFAQSAIAPGRGTGARAVAPSGGGAISYIANATGSGTGGTGTTSTSLNVVSGDKLVIFCQTNGANNTISLTDTIGNTFSKGTHQNDASIGNSDLFYAYSSGSNAADFFTCTNNNAANPNIVALQYRGGATSGAADVLQNGAAVSGTFTTTSFSTTAANEVVVQCLTSNVTPSAGPIGGNTANVRVAGGSYTPYCQDYIFTSTQSSITASATLPGTGAYNGQMGAFK